MSFPDYRTHFLGATDKAAFTAIRHQVDGTVTEIGGMKAGQADLVAENAADITQDATADATAITADVKNEFTV